MNWSPLNVLLQILVAAVALGGAALMLATARRRPRVARATGIAVAATILAYVATALVVGFASREVVLGPGEVKHFCGFYLDCHLNVSVVNISGTPAIGTGATRREAGGNFFFVTVRVGNDAERATLQLRRPGVRVVDDNGRSFAPLPEGDPGLEGVAGVTGLSQPVTAGQSYLTVLVFDLPNGLSHPRLEITERRPSAPERIFELFLIGDEDSLLHRKTTFSLG